MISEEFVGSRSPQFALHSGEATGLKDRVQMHPNGGGGPFPFAQIVYG
jgi:hypothetical protein